jgi:putative endonuclease
LGGTLCIGVTNDLVRRVSQHRIDAILHRLMYYEQFNDIEAAIQREKRLKKWNRAWKIRLSKDQNPDWHDLYPGMAGSR